MPSEFVRSELIELFGLPPERVTAIAPGVDSRFAAPGNPAPVLSRFELDGRPYVLALGTEGARKNLRLLDAIAPRLAASGLDVAVAGSKRAYIATSGAGIARRIGYVDDADLPAVYAGAAAFAMPSLYEGFGLPCIEAMAAGTPVVAADRAALPEACGGAALLADPDDEEAFAAALVEAAGPERDRLIEAGRRRAVGAHLAPDGRGDRRGARPAARLSATGRRRLRSSCSPRTAARSAGTRPAPAGR